MCEHVHVEGGIILSFSSTLLIEAVTLNQAQSSLIKLAALTSLLPGSVSIFQGENYKMAAMPI